MLKEWATATGFENYAPPPWGGGGARPPPPGPQKGPGGKKTPPNALIDYFPDDWLLVVDESHVTCSQLHAMYNGDQARKTGA